jgi:hypothetical protein
MNTYQHLFAVGSVLALIFIGGLITNQTDDTDDTTDILGAAFLVLGLIAGAIYIGAVIADIFKYLGTL